MARRIFLHLFTITILLLLSLHGHAQLRAAEQQADSLLDYAQKNYQLDLASALAATRQALSLAQENELDLFVCKSYTQLGKIYTNVAFYTKAMEKFHMALSLAQEKSLLDQQAEILNSIGSVYYYEDSLDQALSYFEESLKYNERSENLSLLARNLSSIGLVNSRMGNSNKAEYFIRRGLQLNRQLKNQVGICANLASLGTLHLKRKQLDSAHYYYSKELILALQIGDIREIVYGYLGNARLERSLKNTTAAKQLLLNALHYSTQTSLNNELKRVLYELSELEEQEGNFQQALQYNRRYNKLNDSINTLALRTEQKQLQSLLEAERNISENRILKANVAAREHELKASLANQQRQLAVTLATIIALMMLAAIMAFLYYHYRQNKKNHLQLKQMHTAMQTQARELEQAYDKIHQHNLELENSIVERTRQLNLQNRQLIQYAFFNAHKVRGPLARILGLVNLMPKAEHETEFQFILQRLEESARELDGVVHEINLILESKPVHQDN